MEKNIKSFCIVLAAGAALLFSACGAGKSATKTVEVNMPCAEYMRSTTGQIRANGKGESMDQQMAGDMARTNALEQLASKINTSVKSLTESFALSHKVNDKEEFERKMGRLITTSVNQAISDYRTVCEKYTLTTRPDGSEFYTCYYVVEIGKEDVTSMFYNTLSSDGSLNFNYEYEKFKMEMDKAFKDADKANK